MREYLLAHILFDKQTSDCFFIFIIINWRSVILSAIFRIQSAIFTQFLKSRQKNKRKTKVDLTLNHYTR